MSSLQLPSSVNCTLRVVESPCSHRRYQWCPSHPAPQAAKARRRCRPTACRPVTAAAAADACDNLDEAAVTRDFCITQDVCQGKLEVRPAREEDVGPASVLLTRAFAGSPQGIPIQDGRKYCKECLSQPPRGVLLVARLVPTDESLLPPGQSARLVATTGLSFCRDTREEFPTLQPPDDAVYLANMAVDGKLRRQGYARCMLSAAEALCAARGFRRIYLHARLTDTAAQQLYLSSGYVLEDQDSFLVKLRNITPRALLYKELQPHPQGRQ